MVEQSPDNNYEITLLDVPDGAETLLIENEAISVRGRLQGGLLYICILILPNQCPLGHQLTVRRWKDVTIKGGDLFYKQEEPEDEPTKAMELRKLYEPAERRKLHRSPTV